jgi:cell division protein FtsQ
VPAFVRSVVKIVVPLAVLAFIVPPLLGAARRHPYFAVREIVMRHHGRLAPGDLRAALEISEGDSIWDVDPQAAAARLRERPWVRSADVRREFPDRVVVRVREYRPIAIVAVHGDAANPEPELFYVAANGRIFASVGDTDGLDLPYITGLSRADLDGREGFGPQSVHRALGLLRLVTRESAVLGTISEINVDRTAGLTLLPIRPAVPIELGQGDYATKLDRLAKVLPLWVGREGEVRGVSCLFENEIIVRTRAVATAPARGAAGA